MPGSRGPGRSICWTDLLAQGGDRELFRIVVERLADLFEPRLCSVYAELFSEVIARRIPACMPNIWWRATSEFAGHEFWIAIPIRLKTFSSFRV